MDTKQIEYILKIAEENNITKAAEKLFITQSALNQQLLKLEKELGTPLFHRSRTNWRLTEAGEIYIEGAKAALQIKNTTYNRIYDVVSARKGHLTIGLTPGRGLRMFTSIYPELHRSFPNLDVRPIEMRVRAQQDAIAKGEIDVGLMTLARRDQTSDTYYPLKQEELVLIIPSGHPLAAKAAPSGEPLTTLDLTELRYEPFVLMDKTSTLRLRKPVSPQIFCLKPTIPAVLPPWCSLLCAAVSFRGIIRWDSPKALPAFPCRNVRPGKLSFPARKMVT